MCAMSHKYLGAFANCLLQKTPQQCRTSGRHWSHFCHNSIVSFRILSCFIVWQLCKKLESIGPSQFPKTIFKLSFSTLLLSSPAMRPSCHPRSVIFRSSLSRSSHSLWVWCCPLRARKALLQFCYGVEKGDIGFINITVTMITLSVESTEGHYCNVRNKIFIWCLLSNAILPFLSSPPRWRGD